MREFFIWLAVQLLVLLMACFTPVLWAVTRFAKFIQRSLDAVEAELLITRAMRTRKQRSKTR